MALYTWSSDFSTKKNTVITTTPLITEAQKNAFRQKIDAYCPSHNNPYSATDNSTTGGCNHRANGSYTAGSDCSYTVCGCGDDSADPAIGSTGTAYCTSNK